MKTKIPGLLSLSLLLSINCYSTIINVKSYGAAGDGVTDDAIALNKATADLRKGDTLVFERDKLYLTGARINIESECTILGNNATLMPAGSSFGTSGTCLSMGKLLSTTSVSGLSASKGSSVIVLPDSVNANVGDLIQFLSKDLLYSFRADLASFNYTKGQYAIVKSANQRKISISAPFFDSFSISSILVYRGFDSAKISSLNFDLSRQPNSQNSFTGLLVRGTNITVENCQLTGNEYAFAAMQIEGENAVIKNCTVKNFFNIQGFPGGRLGYGISSICNNLLVTGNLISNCKHAFTSSARKCVVSGTKVIGNRFIEDSLKAPQKYGSINTATDYAGTVDAHAGVSDSIIISDNTIYAQGRAFFIRNGRAVITNNIIYQNGNIAGIIGLEERPVESLLFEGNQVALSSPSSYILGRYLSLADDAAFMNNIIIRGNTCSNGWLFFNNSCNFNINGVTLANNVIINGKTLTLIATDPSKAQKNINVENNRTSQRSITRDYGLTNNLKTITDTLPHIFFGQGIKKYTKRIMAGIIPNPAYKTAMLKVSGSNKEYFVLISDLSGRPLWRSEKTNLDILALPIEKFAKGIYNISINNGEEIKTVKLIIGR